MLLFSQGGLKSQARQLQSKVSSIVFNTRHLRISTACLLLSFWLIWTIVLAELLFSYPVWPVEKCLSSIECSVLSVIVLFHAIVLIIGTVGWICSSPTVSTVLIVSPLCFGGAMTGVVVSLYIDDIYENKERYLTTPAIICFVCLWMFIIYAVLIIGRYCRYLKALRLIRSRNRFNVDIFKERVFGTPPLQEFSRMEFARCTHLSDSLIDDIFGDYETGATLH